MRTFCSLNKIFALLAVVIAAAALHAQEGVSDAILRLQSSHSRIGTLCGPSLATADFNHDGHPDGALLLRYGHRVEIEVYFRSHRMRRLSFTSSVADLAISIKDVNEDGSPDLVVEDPLWHHPVLVWLNDGTGRFHAASIGNYLPARDGKNPNITTPLCDKEWNALSESGRVRARHVSGYFDRETSVPSLTCFVRQSVRVLDLVDPSPNLVRGSPVLRVL